MFPTTPTPNTKMLLSVFHAFEAGGIYPLLAESPVRRMRARIISLDTLLRSLAKPRKHMTSMKAVEILSLQPNSLAE